MFCNNKLLCYDINSSRASSFVDYKKYIHHMTLYIIDLKNRSFIFKIFYESANTSDILFGSVLFKECRNVKQAFILRSIYENNTEKFNKIIDFSQEDNKDLMRK
jgi:hypothetical protein